MLIHTSRGSFSHNIKVKGSFFHSIYIIDLGVNCKYLNDLKLDKSLFLDVLHIFLVI